MRQSPYAWLSISAPGSGTGTPRVVGTSYQLPTGPHPRVASRDIVTQFGRSLIVASPTKLFQSQHRNSVSEG